MASFIYFTPGEVINLADLDVTFQVCGDNINLIENRQIQPLSIEWFHYAPPIGFSTDPDINWTSSGTVGGSWGDLSAYTIHSPDLAIDALFGGINDDTIIPSGTPGVGWVLAGPTLSGSNIDLSFLNANARFHIMFFSASANFKDVVNNALEHTLIAVQLRDSAGNWHTVPSSVRAEAVEDPAQYAYSETSTHLSVEGLIYPVDAPLGDSIISGIRVVVSMNASAPSRVYLESSSLVVLFLEGV